MTYTKQQLERMSDFEVNKALSDLEGLRWHAKPSKTGGPWSYSDNYETATVDWPAIELPDYCSTPNDIMPLAFEYAIGVEVNPVRTEWLARTCDINMSNMNFRCFIDENPLRAIVCCLILVLQENKK